MNGHRAYEDLPLDNDEIEVLGPAFWVFDRSASSTQTADEVRKERAENKRRFASR